MKLNLKRWWFKNRISSEDDCEIGAGFKYDPTLVTVENATWTPEKAKRLEFLQNLNSDKSLDIREQASLGMEHMIHLIKSRNEYINNLESQIAKQKDLNMNQLTGIELIAKERQRQIDEEGWTAEHDDLHSDGEMAQAAAVYATVTQENLIRVLDHDYGDGWPWDLEWFKPYRETDGPFCPQSIPGVDRVRCLFKAGALIAAEIDRIERLEECIQ